MKLDPETEDTSKTASVSNMDPQQRNHFPGGQNGHGQNPRMPYQGQKPRTTSGSYAPNQGPPPQQQQNYNIPPQMNPQQFAQAQQQQFYQQYPVQIPPGMYPMGLGGNVVRVIGPAGPIYGTSPQQGGGYFVPNPGFQMGYQPPPGYDAPRQAFNQVPNQQHSGGMSGGQMPVGGPTSQPRMPTGPVADGMGYGPPVGVGGGGMVGQPRFPGAVGAQAYRQPTNTISYANAELGLQQPQTGPPVPAPVPEKRKKTILTFMDPSGGVVEIPTKPTDASERRSSVDTTNAGKGLAGPPETHNNSVVHESEGRPRHESTSEEKAEKATLDARAEFIRQIAQVSKEEKDKEVAVPPARTPLEIKPPPERVSRGASPATEIATSSKEAQVEASPPGETSSVADSSLSQSKPVEVAQPVPVVAPPVLPTEPIPAPPVPNVPVPAEEAIQPAPEVPEPVQTEPDVVASPVKAAEQPPSVEDSAPLSPQILEDAKRRFSVQEGGKHAPAFVGEEPVTELDALEQAAEEKPASHLPGRLVYNRSALLNLEAAVMRGDQKLPEDLKYKLSLIWKSGAPQGNQGGRGGQDTSKYGPAPPSSHLSSGQYTGSMHRVSSDRNMQNQRHGGGPPPMVLSLASREEVVLSSSENAWKPSHKKKQTEIDEDEKLMAEVRALLNKITPNNYEKLSANMLTLPFTETPELLQGAVDVIFEKALDELNYAEIYAKLCRKLIELETKVSEENPKTVKFRTVLLQRAQHYFEKTDKETQDADVEDKEVSAAEAEEKRVKAKRHYLGNIRFISELYRYEMLTDRVILSCFGRLLPKKTDFSDADEEKLECLCKLLMTCSQNIRPEHGVQVNTFFDQLKKMIDLKATSSRIRFLMQDTIDLRANNYVGRKNVVPGNVKPKTLQEVHEEKRQEEMAIKKSVQDMPPMMPRGGPQSMQQQQGGRGGQMAGSHLQVGGMTKNRSVPGNMSTMGQPGRGGDFGGGAKPLPASGTTAKPSKFLNALNTGGKQTFQLGGQTKWSGGSGVSTLGRPQMSTPQRNSAPMDGRSGPNSRENSMSRLSERPAPRGSLTGTPDLREGTPSLAEPSPSPRTGTPSETPTATPLSRSPVNETMSEITADEVEEIARHLVLGIGKSEGAEVQEIITDAAEKLSRFKDASMRQQFVNLLFAHYYEAKTPEKKPISTLLLGVAKEGRLPGDVLEASFGDQIASTEDQLMDVGPSYYHYVVELIGPLVIERCFPLAQLDKVFNKGTPEHAQKYESACRQWLSDPTNLPLERRKALSDEEPSVWSKYDA